MKVTLANTGTGVREYDPSHRHAATFVGVFSFTPETGLIGWFDPDNLLDAYTVCELLVGLGFASKHPGGPGTYGHVDYRVTEELRSELAAQAAERRSAQVAANTARRNP